MQYNKQLNNLDRSVVTGKSQTSALLSVIMQVELLEHARFRNDFQYSKTVREGKRTDRDITSKRKVRKHRKDAES